MNNNKLIAEFMGIDYENFMPIPYDTDWNWWMPVLDKIKEMRCLPDDHDESFSWVCKSSDIEAEYNAVVEFIKQYNNEQ